MAPSFVTTECPSCGEAEIPLDDVVLRVCEDDDSARCTIRCGCGSRFTKAVDEGMSVLLVTVGVAVETWCRPAEVDERPGGLSPLCPADIDAFASAMASGVSVEDLMGIDV